MTPEETREAIGRMHAVLTGALPLMPLLPTVMAVALWDRCGGWQLAAWLVAAVSAPGLRYLLVRRYRPASASTEEAVRWANEVTVSALLDGLVWGVAGIVFLVPDSSALQMLLITMIVGTSAGSIFATSFWPRTEFAFSVPSVGLTAASLAMQGTQGGIGMAIALLVYLGILARIMQQAHATTLEAIRLRFENLALVEELRAQKELAEQANVAKSRFLAAASHDLRQPLHALGLFVAALRDRTTDAAAQPLVDKIARSVGALEQLFNALLDVSRLDAGVVEPKPRHVRLRELLQRLALDFAPLARAKGLEWRCQGPDLVVHTDPALLETILRNLLSNAIRYCEKGSVALEWRLAGGQVAVTVRDTGIGIAPEHQREIFREFFQLQNPERDRDKGLGLGLAIVERLTRLMDCRLTLRSAPGVGSTFEIALPLGNADAVGAEAPPAAEAELGEDGGRLVLVIDDEAAVREAVTILLEDWGYQVVAAASADEAMAALTRAPDVIVADYRLREERTGAEAIRQIQRAWGSAIPALIVTGDTGPDRLRQARESGYAVLHKPVQPAKLRTFLRLSCRRRVTGDAEPNAGGEPAREQVSM